MNTDRDLTQVIDRAVREAVAKYARPKPFKFPEDLVIYYGGYIAAQTFRSWKSLGYVKTHKVGNKAYVTQEEWQWFLNNHQRLMPKNSRRNG
jgi:hypothetical protein